MAPCPPARRFSVTLYGPGRCEEVPARDIDEAMGMVGRGPVAWVRACGPLEAEEAARLAGHMKLPAAMARELEARQIGRPRALEDRQHVMLSMNVISFRRGEGLATSMPFRMLMGRDCIITIENRRFERIGSLDEMKDGEPDLLSSGPDHLFCDFLEMVVDEHYAASEALGERLELVFDGVMAAGAQTPLDEVQRLRRSLSAMRRTLWPLREAVGMLSRSGGLITPKSSERLRISYDHIVELMDIVSSYREALSDMVEIYQTSVSNELGRVLRLLTMISVIFAPLTFIVGFYSMNFTNLPGVGHDMGYIALAGTLAAVAVGMWAVLRKRYWF